MATEPSRPRAVETPLPYFRADAPTDVELGVTTSDDGQWEIAAPRPPVTRRDLGGALLITGLSQARYLILRHGWHKTKRRRL